MGRLLVCLAGLALSTNFAAGLQEESAEQLLRDLKLAVIDKQWTQALDLASKARSLYPKSPRIGEVIYYQAKATVETGRREEGLTIYGELLDEPRGAADVLLEQARLSIIDLTVTLFNEGRNPSTDRLMRSLSSQNKTLRQYAALRLAAIDDRTLARRALPVLNEILETERDEELHNRAILALMRIDPKLAEERQKKNPSRRDEANLMLHVEIRGDNADDDVSVTVPLSLAKAVLAAIPRDALRELEKEGIHAGNLIEELMKLKKQDIIEVRTGDSHVKIWID